MGSKVLIGQSGLVNRYARAFYELVMQDSAQALKKSSSKDSAAPLLSFVDILKDFQSMILEDESLNNFFNSNILNLKDKLKIVDKLPLKGIVKGLLRLLVKNERFYLFPEIINKIKHIFYSENDISEIKVYFADKADKVAEDEITKFLSSKFGRKLEVDYLVEESILGGILIKFGSKLYDFSLIGKLKSIQDNAKNALEIL